VVEALCFKPEGRGFENDQAIESYQFTQSFRPHWDMGFTHPQREMNTRDKNNVLDE
jgi:hypothetical protein